MTRKYLLLGNMDHLGKYSEISSLKSSSIDFISLTGEYSIPISPPIFSKFITIPLIDFHSITIEIIEIEPDLIIYCSPFILQDYNDEEILSIAHEEFIQHLYEIVPVVGCKIVMVSSEDVFISKPSITVTAFSSPNSDSAMGKSLINGENQIMNNNRNFIIRLGIHPNFIPTTRENLEPFSFIEVINKLDSDEFHGVFHLKIGENLAD